MSETTSTVTLVEFLRARIADDEQATQAASPGPWSLNAEGDEVLAADDIAVAEAFALSGNQLRATAVHIARHDPARVLREVEGKRMILDQCIHVLSQGTPAPRGKSGEWAVASIALSALALPYATHPDYREEWRP